MPVRRVKGGYKWGSHGHVYKTRAGAERQARAIYAAGWRGDDNRAARRVKAQALYLAGKVAGDRYRRALRGILRQLHREFTAILEPAIREDARVDGWRQKLARLRRSIGNTAKPTGQAFDAMAALVNKSNKLAVTALVGITPHDLGVEDKIKEFRAQNIALIDKAANAYADDVEAVLGDPDNYGIRVEDLKSKLVERGNVSESRAELIARDQTLKLNGQLNELRQTNAGIESYVWSTSHDERVRPDHAELDGQEFRWSDPPEPGHPGQDINCRCVALAVLPED